MPDKAIGLINTCYGTDRPRDEQTIRALALQHGYDLAGLLIIGADTYMPITLIVHTAAVRGALAILAPSLSHIHGIAAAVALRCTLVTPTLTVPLAAGRAQ